MRLTFLIPAIFVAAYIGVQGFALETDAVEELAEPEIKVQNIVSTFKFDPLVRTDEFEIRYHKPSSEFFVDENGTPFLTMNLELRYADSRKGSALSTVVLNCLNDSMLIIKSIAYDSDGNPISALDEPQMVLNENNLGTPITALIATMCPAILKSYNSELPPEPVTNKSEKIDRNML